MNSTLHAMVGSDERILWDGVPNKKCFICEAVFNPLLPFALIWLIIDLSVLGFAFSEDQSMALMIGAFMILHLMPVWIYLAGVLLSFRKYRNTEYIVTDKAVYVSGGIFSLHTNMRTFMEISDISIRRGVFDQMLGVGDVTMTGEECSISIIDIAEYEYVFKIVKKLQADIHSDIMFPNEYRPKENNGYRTEYKGRF